MTSLAAWPIRHVFRLLVAVTLVACVAIAGTVIWSYNTRQSKFDKYTAMQTAYVDVLNVRALGLDMVSNNTAAQYVPGAAAIGIPARNKDVAAIQTQVAAANQLDIPAAQKQLVQNTAKAYQALLYVLTHVGTVRTQADLARVTKAYYAALGNATASVAAAQKSLDAQTTRYKHDINSTGKTTNIVTLILCLAMALLIGGLILGAGRRITNGVRELQASVRTVATGDLSAEIPVRGRDEMSDMARELVGLRDRLVDVFRQLVHSSERLGGATTNLSGIVSEVGQASDQTSTQMDGVSATANEVSTNIQAVAAGGEEMGASIAEIARSAQDAAREATAAVSAVESTTGTMEKLSESSRQIGDVVRLITSIAEQTNLLALNATIEAARAGDAGKGFAVVADEVKQLAQETARATEDISQRVETIQADAVQAGEAIDSVAGVINRINEFQATIASAVEEQTATTQAINAGVNLAAQGSAQIAQSIGGAAQAAATTAQSMQRGNTSAQELGTMRSELDALIASFRLP